MYEQQHFFDLQDNESFNDPKSWLSVENQFSPPPPHVPHLQRPHSSCSNVNGSDSNVDRVLYKNLVEMVPLVESLMDRRANTSFTRRASLIYTKTPSRESYYKKNSELKGRKAAQSIPSKKRGDFGDHGATSKKVPTDEFSILTARASAVEKDREPLLMLQEHVENLQKQLLEKEERLKSAENSMNQMTSLQEKLEELKCQAAEKDSLIKSVHLQLSDAKIKLADKQAALEKLQWEALTSNRKAEKLQEEIQSMQGELSTFMLLVEELAKNDWTAHSVDYDTTPYNLDQLSYIDDMGEIEMQQMEEAREAYIAALATAKESQDEESLATATKARLRLQSFVLGTKNQNPNDASNSLEVLRASPSETVAY